MLSRCLLGNNDNAFLYYLNNFKIFFTFYPQQRNRRIPHLGLMTGRREKVEKGDTAMGKPASMEEIMEATIKEKEASIKEKEASIKEKEASTEIMEASIKEKEASIKEKEASMEIMEVTKKEKEATTEEKEVVEDIKDLIMYHLHLFNHGNYYGKNMLSDLLKFTNL
ncbi:axoneme-associated protein mst101(1) isoform X1 [Salvelinus sp. IW2-2015]|uniref:axoneme-associated protein mst101(1) isoform X1 n=1 Tax=Salvelinus sp. IW2-2015 TaxID=2691554 RepID=UPI0038D4A2E9